MLKDAMLGAFRAIPAADPAHYVRGQYEGYLDTPGVAEGSTPIEAAARATLAALNRTISRDL